MNKLWIAQVVFLLVLVIGAGLLSLEIFARHMDPDRVILFAVVTGVGLLGASVSTLRSVHNQWTGKQ